jgi:hypothetical protein
MAAVTSFSLLGSGIMYARMLGGEGYVSGDYLARCGALVQRIVAADQRIVVSTTSPSVMAGVPNNFEEPTVFFYARRYGWSLPADRHFGRELDSLRAAGAAYFVMPYESSLKDHPDLQRYLAEYAERIDAGRDEGLGVYMLREGFARKVPVDEGGPGP